MSQRTGALQQSLRTLRILILAMFGGLAAFTAFAFKSPIAHKSSSDAPPVTSFVAVGMGLLFLVVAPLVSRLTVARERRRIAKGQFPAPAARAQMRPEMLELVSTDEGKLGLLYYSKTIILCAMYEGAALFAVVAYMNEREPFTLGIAGLLAFCLIWQFPTQIRVENWFNDQLQRLRNEPKA